MDGSQDYRREYKGTTVVVTGGAGCIGSNLVRALLAAGVRKVVALDDFSASCRWNLPEEDDRLVVVKGSVVEKPLLHMLFVNYLPRYVFHLAAHFANQNSVDHPEADLETNGRGTMLALQWAAQTKSVKQVVYASSGCSVYGSQAPLPLKEDYVSLHLDTPYQIHKLLGELYCNYYHNYYGLPVAIARYFNVFGPGEVPGPYRNVIPNFMWLALHGRPLPITGTGEETRDFTYVDDIVDGTLRLGVAPEAVGEAFNLASGVETQIIDVATHVNRIAENRAGIEMTRRRDWDKITRRRASIEKAMSVLGYEPKTSVIDGIKAVRDWVLLRRAEIERDLGSWPDAKPVTP